MRLKTTLTLGTFALALASCGAAPDAADSEVTAPAAGLTQLPVSTNATMVGLIDQSADYIWALGNGDMPRDDHDWDQVRAASYDMIIAGAVIQVPGTGEHDAEWASEDSWRHWSEQLTAIGQDALPLAEARSTDVEAWRDLGNRLIDNCEGCHQAFKPEIPSQGILHEEVSRDAEGMSIFD